MTEHLPTTIPTPLDAQEPGDIHQAQAWCTHTHNGKGRPMDDRPYVIVRTYSAGAFAGHLVRRDGQEVELADARRLWYWAGAASLSGLAIHGTSKPNTCKFPAPVHVTVTEAIEIIDVTAEAEASIKAVPEWRAL